MKKYWFAILSVLGLGLFLIPALVLADVTLQLDPVATITPGSTVIITGTLTNQDEVNSVALNGGYNFSAYSTDVSVDSASTQVYLPQTLGPRQQYQGPILKVLVSSTAQPQNVSASYSLLGATATTSTTTLTSATFVLPIVAAASTTTVTSGTTTDYSNFVGLQMPQQQTSQYPNGPRLIKLDGDSTVYWVSPSNIKIPMFSAKAFLSYGNKWSDIQSVGQAEFDSYPMVRYIQLNGKGSIYYVGDGKYDNINSGVRRFVPTSVWNTLPLNETNELLSVNSTDFYSYKLGSKIGGAADINQPVQNPLY